MAINRNTTYGGRWAAPTTEQPEGAFINKSGPGAEDGSYLEQTWANDWAAFFSALGRGQPANGTPDTATNSQLYGWLIDLIVPVNTIITLAVEVDPGTYYAGTTWEQVAQGQYAAGVGEYTDSDGHLGVISAGEDFTGTSRWTVKLTEANLPPHRHAVGYFAAGSGSNQPQGAVRYWDEGDSESVLTSPGGGTAEAFNNYPPFYGMYYYRRVS